MSDNISKLDINVQCKIDFSSDALELMYFSFQHMSTSIHAIKTKSKVIPQVTGQLHYRATKSALTLSILQKLIQRPSQNE